MKGNYGWIKFIGTDGYEHFRKLTSKGRQEVLTNYIRRCSGRKFTVGKLAEMLGACERTIQNHLAKLEAKGWIKRQVCFDDVGRQGGNVIVYTGPKKRLTGKELTMEKIYDENFKHGLDEYY